MQNKFFFNICKWFFYVGILIIFISFSQFFTGCSGSDEVEVSQRDLDSVEVYTNLQKSFALYKKALDYNESSDTKNSAQYFEMSLTNLNKINYGLIIKPENYFWKKDYDELAKSIVEDYLITQTEISQSSLVFDFAKKVQVNYEKVEEVKGDREPLPNGTDVPLVRNSAVDQYIDFFSKTERGRSFIDKCLYRSGKFFPIMRKILKFNNAPEELIYLSVQESGLSPVIISRAGAVGLWQFMPSTGNSYGLYQDGYTDDRRDFEKSTDAASRLLKDLYRTFDDWYLAFSAYNAGPGRVKKAISKSGSKDFWALRNYLPGETKNYVPSIIALSFVLRNPEEYGFKDVEYGSPLVYDRVNIKSQISLQKVAELCESDIETIRELNSELTNDMVPLYDVPYQLRIPHKSFEKFAANYESAGDIDKSSNYTPEFAGNETAGFIGNVALAQYRVNDYQPDDIRNIGGTNGKMKVSHEYKKKELLEVIAVKYSVRSIDIRLWNNLAYGTQLKSKQHLDIYVSTEKYKMLYGMKDGDLDKQVRILENSNSSETDNSKKDTDGSSKMTNTFGSTYSDNSDNSVSTTEDTDTPDNTSTVEKTSEHKSGDKTNYYYYKKNNNSNETPPVSVDNSENNSDNNSDNTSDNSNSVDKESQQTQVQSENEQTQTQPQVTDEQQTDVRQTETPQTEYREPETKTVSNKKNTSYKTYTVEEGENLTMIANEFGVSVSDLEEWNNLETDKIMVGQKLKVTSVHSKTSVHTVSEGENLTMIADEYGLTLTELKDLNNIKGDVIFTGQKLKVTGTPAVNKNNTKTSGVKKTYKVKKGETLASISETFDISIQDLKKWNNLKNDNIMSGQILKLYDDGTGTKVRKKKN